MVKFCVFADLHYRVGDWCWCEKRLDNILARARREHAAFVMHCGDFCHDVVGAKAILDKYNHADIPTYHTLGNHEFECTDGLPIVLEALGIPKNFYFFDCEGVRFISLDTNYHYSEDGTLLNYADDTAWANCHQKNLILSPEELEFLEDAVSTAPGPCVLFSHASPSHMNFLANASEVHRILQKVRGDRTILWINGHYHRNNLVLEVFC